MPTLTVRNLDPHIRDALKALGAEHGRSMEAEVRTILAEAVRPAAVGANGGLGSRIRERFSGLGGIDIIRLDDKPRVIDLNS